MTRYLSLFSGIEAASAAWHPLGWECVGVAEVEPFPCAVLAHHYPDAPNFGDVTAADFIDRARELGAVDVVVGGSPCQAFSVAGLRRSLEDDRGNLTLRYVEIVNAINPAFVVWENVPGVLSTPDNAFGCFLGGLVGADAPLVPSRGQRWTVAGVAVGPRRSAAWRVLDAQYFGLAQRRRRVFVVACPRDGANPAAVLLEPAGLRRNPPSRREEGEGVAAYTPGSIGGYREGSGTLRAHGGDYGGGTETLIARSLNAHGRRIDGESETFVTHSLRAEGFDASEDGTGRGMPLVPVTFDWQAGGGGKDESFRGKSRSYIVDKPGKSRALTANKTLAVAFHARQDPDTADVTHPLDTDGHSVAIAFAERGTNVSIDGDLAATLKSASDNAGGRQCIAFDTTQIAHPENRCNPQPGDPCHPLAAGAHAPAVAVNLRGRDGGAMPECDDVASLRAASGGSSRSYVQQMLVRRLTPRECERLQGFTDDYTLIPYRGKPAADGPRYRALGNSMAVPVMRWIGERIERIVRVIAEAA